MKRQNKAYLFAILAVLCWSTVASAFKLTLRQVDYLTLLLYSSFVSTVLLFLILLLQGKLALLVGSNRRALLHSAANGFLNPFLYYVILFKAYSLLPAQEAQPLNFTWPLMLVILSAPMLGERIRPLSILALMISFLGVLIISTHGDVLSFRFTNLPGALLAMGSATIWALFWLTNVRDERDEVLKLFYNFFFGFIYICAGLFILSKIGTLTATNHGSGGSEERNLIEQTASFPPCVPMAGLLGCIYVGIVEMGAAFVLWLKALSLSEGTARVSNLIFLAPFISLIFIHFVAGETILPSSIIGLVFIAGGILIQRTVGGAVYRKVDKPGALDSAG